MPYPTMASYIVLTPATSGDTDVTKEVRSLLSTPRDGEHHDELYWDVQASAWNGADVTVSIKHKDHAAWVELYQWIANELPELLRIPSLYEVKITVDTGVPDDLVVIVTW